MRVLSAGLSQQTPVTIYDKTKPYMAGRAFRKNISGTLVYGPPLTRFINTEVDATVAPLMSETTPNGRQFQVTTVAAGVATIVLYNIDTTGQTSPTYVGKLLVRLPNTAATTHTIRAFKVYDGANNAATTGWQIYIGTTGSVLINGGLFIVNNVGLSDFVPTSPATIEMAVANGAKAVYMAQDPGTIGVNNTLTAMQGLSLDRASRRLYFNNNVLATTQFAVFDPSVSPTLNGLSTASAANTNSTATTFNFTGHPFAANDPVILIGTVPTGFTASSAAGAQTVYFIRNPTANTFELSATTGGASILGTSVVSGTQAARAFGQSTAQWLSIRTGTITGFTGTILLTNGQKITTPQQSLDPAIPSGISGQICIFLPTNSTFHLFKASDIVNGATTLPSMVAVNAQGSGVDYTAIAPAYATYSGALGRVVYISNTAQFYMKRWVNGVIDAAFGGINTTYLETPGAQPYSVAGVTITNIEIDSGVLYATLGTTGQRGILVTDIRSDSGFNFSFITSPVLDTSNFQQFKTIQTVEKLFDLTSSMVFSYKTAATSADSAFNDPTTGWTVVPIATDLSSIALNNLTQFRIDFTIASGSTNTPAQINELYASFTARGESSDNWLQDNDFTTQGLGSPSYVAFYLRKAYPSGTVPRLFSRVYDTSNNLIFSSDTVGNPPQFQYSTNNGVSWIALGTIPNTVGTLVRVLVTPTPSALALASIGES